MPPLNPKVALVTGGASGLGKAIAQRLARDGARVVISDIQREAGMATAREGRFVFLEHDVTNESRWGEVLRELEARVGPLGILINNAGIAGPMDAATPESTRLADWRAIFAINVEGVFLGCKAAIAAMRRGGGGSIINISSVAGLQATPQGMAYGASKAAVRHLTKSVAQYCAQERLNIRCNSVHPGDVMTPLWEKLAAELAETRGATVEQVIAEAKAACPLGELTQPEDVAAAVAFLASDEARHITGVPLIVDGGLVHCDTFRAPLLAKGARALSAEPGNGRISPR